MQVTNCFNVAKNCSLIVVLAKVLLVVCVLHVLYFLFITSSYDTKYIGNKIAGVLGIDAIDLKFIEGGRRYDTMIMFEYLGDKRHLAKLRPEILDVLQKTPDKLLLDEQELQKEEQELLQFRRNQWLQPIRAFLSRHAISGSVGDDAEVFPCFSESFPNPGYILIVFGRARVYVFYPT